MKKILYLSMLSIIALFSSCDDIGTEDISRITEYAVITPEGGDLIYVEKGSSYTAAATSSGGEEVRIKNDVDVNQPSIYSVVFTATNADGFDASTIQTVVVYEEDDVLAGVYDAIRVGRNGGLVLIYSNGDGTYSCTDLVGAYYEYGKGYGSRYASPTSKMELSGSVITADPGAATPWGPWGISNGVKTGDVLTWKVELIGDGFGFDVQLTKKSI